MAKDSYGAALAGFERWTATTKHELSADAGIAVGEVETLLDLMRDYLDLEGPAGLGEGDLTELLLTIYPRKITVLDPASAGTRSPRPATYSPTLPNAARYRSVRYARWNGSWTR